MSDEILLQGKKYRLVPVEDSSILDDYKIKDSRQDREMEVQKEPEQIGFKDAVPKVSDYRERYKQRKVRASEIQVQPRIVEVEDKTEGLFDGYEYKGEGLFFGEGLTRDLG